MQLDGAIERFYAGICDLKGSAIFEALPKIQVRELESLCQAWLLGQVGPIDPTNMLVAADQAEQFLELPRHASVLYDAALEQLSRHPDLIAKDTDCAAASLNLLGIVQNAGRSDQVHSIALRATKMPVKEDGQKVRLAYFLNEVGEFTLAQSLFTEGMRRNPDQVAEETGVPLDDLRELGRRIALASKLQYQNPKLSPEVRDASQLSTDLLIAAFSCSPLWDAAAFFFAHLKTYLSAPGTSAQFNVAGPHWEVAIEAHESGQHNKAIQELQTAIRLFPGLVEAYGLLAGCWLELERPAEALRVLDNGLATLGGDYPEFRAMRARALSALGQPEHAAVEWIKELFVVGATSELLRSILQACLNLLPKTYDLTEYRRNRNALEVALACSGRIVSEEGDSEITDLFAKLYSRYELVGPISPHHVARITGMDWETVRGIYRAHAD